MSTPVDKADDPNYLKADKYDSLDKNSGIRAKIYNISLTPINDIFYVPPGNDGSVGLSPEKLDKIMELVQQLNVEARINELDKCERLLKTKPLDSAVSLAKEHVMLDWIKDRKAILATLKELHND